MSQTTRTSKELFLAHIDAVGETAAYLWRRHDLPPDEREDFESYVKLRLVDNDYERVQCFRGQSAFRTFLISIVHNLFHDYHRRRWGRWRPSRAARDSGMLAVELETLLYRDGYTFEEAYRTLTISRGRDVSRDELSELAAELPTRHAIEEVGGVGDLGSVASEIATPSEAYDHAETEGRVERALQEAIARLDAGDRLMLKMRYADDMSVPAIGRALGRDDVSRLYRRLKKLQKSLREGLVASGVGSHDVDALLTERVEIDLDFELEAKISDSCPSNHIDEEENTPPN